MPLIVWSEMYRIGIAELDSQHEQLVKLINQLYSALTAMQGDKGIAELLAELRAYTELHFTTEEAYMQRSAYTALMEHAALHCAFREKIDALAHAQASGEPGIAGATMSTMHHWLYEHLLEKDKHFAQWYLSQGTST